MQDVKAQRGGQTHLISVQRSDSVFILETHVLFTTVILTLKISSYELQTSIFGAMFFNIHKIAGPTLIGNPAFFE